MAISTQTFQQGNTSACATALKTALEGTNLFDSVTISDLKITCTKNSVAVLTVDLGVTSSNVFVTWNNTDNNATDTTFDWDQGNASGIKPSYYATITTIGNAVYATFSYTHSTAASGMTRVFCLYVGATKDGNIGIYVCKTATADGTNLNCYTMSTGAYSPILTACVSAPVSTSMTAICAYPLSTIKKSGDIDVFSDAYALRYSPPIHTLSCNQVGVTPVKIAVDNVVYLTDGVIMIKNV